MLKEERHNIIMKLINETQSVRTEELEKILGVSGETIRRDLIQLEMDGLLRRVHGGAVIDNTTINEFQMETRIKAFVEEKQAIAATAADMVREGEAVAIVASTTTSYMGIRLYKKNNITVVTNSISLAQQIALNESNRVIFVGGELWASDQKTMGALAELGLRNHRVDKVFFSATGISLKYGITEYNSREAEFTSEALKIGRKKIFLSDHSKFDAVAFCKVTDADGVDTIITDWKTSNGSLLEYDRLGIDTFKAKRI